MFEESARKLLRELYKSGVVTDQMLEDAEFFEKDIAEIKTDKEWFCLYDNAENWDRIKVEQMAVEQVLGTKWKRSYEYKEYAKYNQRYGLWLKVTKDQFDKICARCEVELKAAGFKVW